MYHVYAKEKVKAYYFWMLVITFLVERRGVGGGGSKHCLLTVHDSLRFLTVYDSLHFFKTYTLIIHLIKHNQTNVYNKYTEVQYMHFTMIKKKVMLDKDDEPEMVVSLVIFKIFNIYLKYL